jgi:hypothetical protein
MAARKRTTTAPPKGTEPTDVPTSDLVDVTAEVTEGVRALFDTLTDPADVAALGAPPADYVPPTEGDATADTEPKGDEGKGDEPTATVSPEDAFAAAYAAAIEAGDGATGTVPSGPMGAVLAAYRALPWRGNARVTAIDTAAREAMRAAKANGTAGEAFGLTEAIREAIDEDRAKGSTSTTATVPDVDTLTRRVVALDLLRTVILSTATEADRRTAEAVAAAVADGTLPITEDDFAPGAIVAAMVKGAKGTKASGKDLRPILDAIPIETVPVGTTLTLTELNRVIGRTGGALFNRLTHKDPAERPPGWDFVPAVEAADAPDGKRIPNRVTRTAGPGAYVPAEGEGEGEGDED